MSKRNIEDYNELIKAYGHKGVQKLSLEGELAHLQSKLYDDINDQEYDQIKERCDAIDEELSFLDE